MRVETKLDPITVAAGLVILVCIFIATSAHASYIQVDANNFRINYGDGIEYDIYLSPLDDSCLFVFSPTCTALDVGKVTYDTAQAIPNLMTGDRMLQLFAEGIFSDTIVPGGIYYVLDETGNPSTTFKPTFNADFGTVGEGIGAFFYATETVSAVPVPASIWLFGSGLLGVVGVARRKAR